MNYYKVECYHRFIEFGDCPARYLGLVGFSVNPLLSVEDCFDYVKSWQVPDFIDAFVIRKVSTSETFTERNNDMDILLNFD